MTQKVNGAAYPGIWVEKQVTFVKLTFSTNIAALAYTSLYELGTTTQVSSSTVADSTFGIVESAIVQALKTLETTATVLGVSKYDASAHTVDVMLGYAEGWFSDAAGSIATGLPVLNAEAIITVAGSAAADAVGVLVSVKPSAVTFDMDFATFDGTMAVATASAGDLMVGPGATPGSAAYPNGEQGYYPVALTAA
jgi:hypothetical protein